jgi:hypothetical protein
MSYKELKDYINRTLGSSLKCVLPSYWWKKIFGYIVGTMEETEASLRESLNSGNNAYKDRCFYLAEYRADDYKAHNAELFNRIILGALGYAPREPIYFLTGSDLNNETYTCCPNYTTAVRVNFNDGDGYDFEYYIRALDIPIERSGLAEVEIYQDGSYAINPNLCLHFRADNGELTDEQKTDNKKVINPWYSFGGDVSWLPRIHCYSNGKYGSLFSVVGCYGSERFMVLERDGLAEVRVDYSTGESHYCKWASFQPTYYLPKGVADLTPENNKYKFTESEATEWGNLHPYGGASRFGVRFMAPYKSGGLSEPLYKQCDITHPTNGASESYYADIVEFDDDTSKVIVKRILYNMTNLGGSGLVCEVRFLKSGTFDYTPTTTA